MTPSAANSSSIDLPAFPAAAMDTVGAGDTFVGAFAAALLEGQAPKSAARFASAAAAIAVTRKGAQESIPIRAEVISILDQDRHAPEK